MDERLVAVEDPMPPGEQIAFEPALALVLAEHFHHAPGGGKKLVIRHGRGFPLAFGHFKKGLQAIGERLVGTKDAEIPLLAVQLGHIAQESARAHACRRCRALPARARRPRSRGNPASGDRAAECRRWRGDWRPCVVRPWAQVRPVPVSAGPAHRKVPRAGSFSASLPTA